MEMKRSLILFSSSSCFLYIILYLCRGAEKGGAGAPPGIPKWSGAPPPKSEMLLLGALFEKNFRGLDPQIWHSAPPSK